MNFASTLDNSIHHVIVSDITVHISRFFFSLVTQNFVGMKEIAFTCVVSWAQKGLNIIVVIIIVEFTSWHCTVKQKNKITWISGEIIEFRQRKYSISDKLMRKKKLRRITSITHLLSFIQHTHVCFCSQISKELPRRKKWDDFNVVVFSVSCLL